MSEEIIIHGEKLILENSNKQYLLYKYDTIYFPIEKNWIPFYIHGNHGLFLYDDEDVVLCRGDYTYNGYINFKYSDIIEAEFLEEIEEGKLYRIKQYREGEHDYDLFLKNKKDEMIKIGSFKGTFHARDDTEVTIKRENSYLKIIVKMVTKEDYFGMETSYAKFVNKYPIDLFKN